MNSDAIGLLANDVLSIPDRACAERDGGLVRAVKHERTFKKCLHCERQLPMMVRAFSKAPFCTPLHEQEYRDSMEVLMMDRLRTAALRIRIAKTSGI